MPSEQVERLEYSRPPELPCVEILRGEGCQRLFSMFHETYAVSAVYASHGEWLYRGRSQWLRPGELSLMEPGEVHRNRSTEGISAFRVAFLPTTLVLDAAADLGLPASPPRIRFAQMGEPRLFRAFRSLHAALERPSTPLERQSRLGICLDLYLSRCMERTPAPSARGPERPALRRVVDYLRANLSRNCSLDDLSRVAGLSRFHLLRTFARRMGVPLHEYQIQLRVAQARTRLRHGASLADLAPELGFADQSHLTRHFRRIVGVTPARYARS